MPANNVFISYAHTDHAWLAKIQLHLNSFFSGSPVVWDDTQLRVGDQWRVQIERAMRRAKVAVCLVSADFLASGFIRNTELPTIIDLAETQGLRIVWCLIRDCAYDRSPLNRYQAAHDVAHPLNTLAEARLDSELKMIARQVYEAARAADGVGQKVSASIVIFAPQRGLGDALRCRLFEERADLVGVPPSNCDMGLRSSQGGALSALRIAVAESEPDFVEFLLKEEPDLVLAIGEAAGWQDQTHPGEVVLATEVVEFETGTGPFSTKVIRRRRLCHDRLLQGITVVASDQTQPRTGLPLTHVGVVLSGDSGLLSRKNEWEWALRDVFRDALAIDVDDHTSAWRKREWSAAGLDISYLTNCGEVVESDHIASESEQHVSEHVIPLVMQLLRSFETEVRPLGSQPKVDFTVTFSARKEDAEFLRERFARLINDPYLTIRDVRTGSLRLTFASNAASAAYAGALWRGGILKDVMKVPIISISDEPKRTGCFGFDRLLDSIEALRDSQMKLDRYATHVSHRRVAQFGAWKHSIVSALGAVAGGEPGSCRPLTQAELRRSAGRHRFWLRSRPFRFIFRKLRADLRRRDFTPCSLRDIILRQADLTHAFLAGVDGANVDLRMAELTGANLAAANLPGARLDFASISNGNLTCVRLLRASLRHASLSDADLSSADLSGSELTCGKLLRAKLVGASLRSTSLRGACLDGADLGGADLTGCNLRDASIRNCNVKGAVFSNADTRNLDVTGVNLADAVGFSEKQLCHCRRDKRVKYNTQRSKESQPREERDRGWLQKIVMAIAGFTIAPLGVVIASLAVGWGAVVFVIFLGQLGDWQGIGLAIGIVVVLLLAACLSLGGACIVCALIYHAGKALEVRQHPIRATALVLVGTFYGLGVLEFLHGLGVCNEWWQGGLVIVAAISAIFGALSGWDGDSDF